MTYNSASVFKHFDLSPLMASKNNWVVDDAREGGKFSYEINVCRALVPTDTHNCSRLSGGCQLIDGGLSKDMGLPSNPVYNPTTDSLFLTYTGGAKCHNGTHNRSTSIEFVCAKDKNGKPIAGSLV